MARTLVAASSQYLQHNAAVVAAEPLTMAAWFNPASIGNNVILAVSTEGGVDRWQLQIAAPAAVHALLASPLGSSSGNAGTPTAGAWQHGAAVFASSTSRTAYYNGTPGTTDTVSVAVNGGVANRTNIGARFNTAIGGFWDGGLAEAAIWNVALTAAEIAALAKGFSPLLIRPTALVAHWPLIGRHSPELSRKGGSGMTLVNAPAQADHPRIIMPRQLAA